MRKGLRAAAAVLAAIYVLGLLWSGPDMAFIEIIVTFISAACLIGIAVAFREAWLRNRGIVIGGIAVCAIGSASELTRVLYYASTTEQSQYSDLLLFGPWFGSFLCLLVFGGVSLSLWRSSAALR